jgi:hypothetical protein
MLELTRLAAPPNAPAQVRLEFVRVVGDWMLRLRERSDHEGRLLPYVLAALVDDAPAVAAEAAALLEDLGQQYEEEHAQEVRELRAYCLDELADGEAACPLPAALGGRLRLGARLLVRGNAGRLLAPLCADLSSWQAGPRVR